MKTYIYVAASLIIFCAGTGISSVLRQTAGADELSKSSSAPISFQLAKPDKPLILLNTLVNDKGPFIFVLDTGAGGTILSPALAQMLDVISDENSKPNKATGAGGHVDIRFAKVDSIQIGTTRVEATQVGVMDLEIVSTAIDTKIDGIIGYNFLKNFRLVVDYPRQTVSFE